MDEDKAVDSGDAGDAIEEEEEVELFSTDKSLSSSSSGAAPLSGAFSEKLSLSPRRCVSKELIDQMPSLSTNTRYHEATVPQPFGCFHLMQLIEKSIQVGALFSPKLYVPKEIWQQDRVKLAGVALKMEVFHQFKQALERTSMHLPLASDDAKTAFHQELDVLLESARQQRVQLARAFPFLHVDPKSGQPSPTHASAAQTESNGEADSAAVGTATAGMAIGKLTNLAFGFGRMVKKQAIAAVERVGAMQPTAVPLNELEEYAAVLCMFFNSTRSIELLLGVSAEADGTQEQVNELKADAVPPLDESTLKRLQELAIFLDEVVVELVMRDVQLLLESFLRRMTRSFGVFAVGPSTVKRPPVTA